MKNNKFTPGPWKVEFDGSGCHCDFGMYVFNTVESDEYNDLAELKANANLIAAAPEMFESLEEMISEIYEQGLLDVLPEDSLALKELKARLKAAEQAIKKARGE